MRAISQIGAAAAAFALLTAGAAGATETSVSPPPETASIAAPPVRTSIAVGAPNRGALIFGVQLPAEGDDFFTWDFPLRTSPNRSWRRWGTDGAVSRTLEVIAAFRDANPLSPRVGIADLSRPDGGPFGRKFGGLGHASHQNGLDVDVLYPRLDHQEHVAPKAKLIDRALSQELVDSFVAAGAQYVFIGKRTKLTGPKKVVQRIPHHDDHLHVRWRATS